MGADWILIACLKQLFAEFDAIAPRRSHASDGSIGDAAHAREVSDHNPDETGKVPIHDADHINEVHAIDVDNKLGIHVDGYSDPMEGAVQFLLKRCRSGAETRLRYIIYNRRIWDYRSDWAEKAYTGASAHTEHAHFSASYDSDKEASTASWHLEELADMTPDEMRGVLKEFLGDPLSRDQKTDKYSSGIGQRVWWNDINGQRAWQALDNTFKLAQAVASKLDVPISEVLTAVGQVDEQVLASLADAGRSDEDVAASLRAALGDRAKAVGELLAGQG